MNKAFLGYGCDSMSLTSWFITISFANQTYREDCWTKKKTVCLTKLSIVFLKLMQNLSLIGGAMANFDILSPVEVWWFVASKNCREVFSTDTNKDLWGCRWVVPTALWESCGYSYSKVPNFDKLFLCGFSSRVSKVLRELRELPKNLEREKKNWRGKRGGEMQKTRRGKITQPAWSWIWQLLTTLDLSCSLCRGSWDFSSH